MRSEIVCLGSLLVGAALALGLAIPAARGDASADRRTIPVSEIHEGMRGYGLTVFKGTEPERFDVEVIGVLHNSLPGQDFILIRTDHPRLAVAKTVAGMSGSPVFLDGRLAGAYAYSLSSFPVEPVAGVTPIGLMLKELSRPIPPGFWDEPLPTGRLATSAHAEARPEAPLAMATRFDGPPGEYDVRQHATQLAARLGEAPGSPQTRASTPLLLSGVSDRAAAALRATLVPLGIDPLQTGGGDAVAAGAPEHFVDGGTLGVQLVRGDISMLALGTVTHVEGTRLVGFGHPMMSAGDSALPTAIARVLWINAGAQKSFKVGESVRPLGTLVQDRQSAVVIDETRRAPTFPVSVEVVGAPGAPQRSWHAEVTHEPFMAPNLVAGVFGSVVDATASEQRDLTWQLRSKVFLRGHGTLELRDFGVAVGGTPDQGDFAGTRVVRAIGDVLNNPWERVKIEKVESTLTVAYERKIWHLRGVEVTREVIEAGQPAHVRVHLIPYQGKELVREFAVAIPPQLAGTDVEVEVVPGFDVAPETAAPVSLTELLANETRQSFDGMSLVFQVKVPAQGVVSHGTFAPGLPAFAFDALRPAHSTAAGEAVWTYARTVVPLDSYVDGRDKVKVRVRRALR